MKTYEVVWSPEIDASSDADREGRIGTVIDGKIYYMCRHDPTKGGWVFDRETDECIEGPSCDPSKNECSPVVIDGKIYRL